MTQPLKWLIVILSPVILILCLLSFGNPQWGKCIYMWQAYVWPREGTEDYLKEIEELKIEVARWEKGLTGKENVRLRDLGF
jgi:hypothetical protein